MMEESSKEVAVDTSSFILLSYRGFYFNWILIMLTTFNNVAGYSMSISTLYNFVTNSKNQTCGTPGLGETETIYAVAAAMYHGGITVGAVMSTLLLKRVDYRRLLTIGPLFQVVGGLLYANGTTGWMIILARLFIGANYGLGMSVNVSYLTFSAREYYYNGHKEPVEFIKNKTSKINKLKKKLMITYGLITYISYIPISGLVSLVSRFANDYINQFRWVGWFQASCSVTLVLLILYVFNDRRDRLPPKVLVKDTKKSTVKWQTIAVIVYLIITGYTVDSILTVLDTMISLVLSEYFGFSAGYISYFFTVVLILSPCSPIILLIAQRMGVSSRLLLLVGLIIGTMGLICLGDWQSIVHHNECSTSSNNITIDSYTVSTGHSECSDNIESICASVSDTGNCPLLLLSNDSSQRLEEITIYYYQMKFMWEGEACPLCNSDNNCKVIHFHANSNLLCHDTTTTAGKSITATDQVYITGLNASLCLSQPIAAAANINCTQGTLVETLISVINTLTNDISSTVKGQQSECESQTGDECYWNQESLITGTYCTDCIPLCRSKKGSLSFPQFCIGAVLAIVAIGTGRSIMFPILTKTSPPHLQELTTSILVLVGAISSFVTPIWTTALYVSSNRTTYQPIAIMVLCQVPVYIGFCIFYKQLTTKRQENDKKPKFKKNNNSHSRPSISSILPIVDPIDDNDSWSPDRPNSPICFMPPHIIVEEDIDQTSDEHSLSDTIPVEVFTVEDYSIFETPL